MKKTAILSVTNDLTGEQRVHKVCLFLESMGLKVTLIGRKKANSLLLQSRSYKTKRLFLLFETGPLFYLEYNFRLFLYLLFHRADVLVANDLDTLLANYIASRLKQSILVHDIHEYFTGVPELEGRPIVKRIWKGIEKWIFPKLNFIYTVNESIAELYRKEYGLKMKIVRNFPILNIAETRVPKTKKELGIIEDKKIILYQGSINVDRGIIEAVEAMQYVEGAVLLIVGDGDILEIVKQRATSLNLQEKIVFKKKVPFETLRSYTLLADIGISLDKDTNLNYKFSLPNKIFDYVHAGVPVLASPLVEIKKIYSTYEIGLLITNHDPKHIAEKMNEMIHDDASRIRWKENCLKAAQVFCWENEKEILDLLFSSFIVEDLMY